MARRSYQQNCALALALDRVGERWTLLLLRELLTGPKRFKELLKNLPGIGTNLLATRLKELERAGLLLRRTLPPPAGSSVYDLTNAGRSLEPALLALARWGAQFAGWPRKGYAYRANWVAVGLMYRFRPEAAEGVRETYQYEIDGEVFHACIGDGNCEVHQGPGQSPAFRLVTNTGTLMRLATGEFVLEQAVKSRRLRLEGSRKAFARSLEIFGAEPLPRRRS